MQLCSEVRRAMRVLRLADVCADGSPAAPDLIGDDRFVFCLERFYEVDDGYGEVEGLGSEFAF